MLETFEEESDIPGTGKKAKSTAVSLEYDIKAGTITQHDKQTFHEFNIDGKWRWIIRNPEPYRQGKCP